MYKYLHDKISHRQACDITEKNVLQSTLLHGNSCLASQTLF